MSLHARSTLRGALFGAAAMYFLDPARGRSRRAYGRDRTLGLGRRGVRRAKHFARGVNARIYGWSRRLRHIGATPRPVPDDAELAHKVQTQIFRDPTVPKGQIAVNAEHGVVFLRGEVDSFRLIEDLERATRQVRGVADVHNLLHLPGEPAPGQLLGGRA
jgi:hypothetical protein